MFRPFYQRKAQKKAWKSARDAENQLAESAARDFAQSHPHLTRDDYLMFVRGVVDNMMTLNGAREYIGGVVLKLTPAEVASYREDEKTIRESGGQSGHGYVGNLALLWSHCGM